MREYEKTVRRMGTVRRTVNGRTERRRVNERAAGGRLKSRGLSLLEVLVSLGILSLFLLGGPQVPPKAGLALYVSSLKLQAKAKEVLVAAWLARGKLEEMGVTASEGSEAWMERPTSGREESGAFAPPHDRYAYAVTEQGITGELSFKVLSLTVTGPTGGRVTLRVLR